MECFRLIVIILIIDTKTKIPKQIKSVHQNIDDVSDVTTRRIVSLVCEIK